MKSEKDGERLVGLRRRTRRRAVSCWRNSKNVSGCCWIEPISEKVENVAEERISRNDSGWQQLRAMTVAL